MVESIQELLRKHSSSSDHIFESSLAELSEKFGESVYDELFLQLTGKSLGSTKSNHYWQETLAHRDRIGQGVPHRLSLRAALLDLLSNSFGELNNPVFVEAEYLEKIQISSITDGLTGLYNQTYFKSLLYQNIPLRRRVDDSTCALILMDIDSFKQYNDRCGHWAGDEALRAMALIIREQIREHDVAARYGGEEFAIYLPNATKPVACVVAERIRLAVEAAIFPGQELLNGKCLTISGGLAVFPQEAEDAKTLFELADRELYRAKQRRNSISPSNYERRKNTRHPTQSLLEFSVMDYDATETAVVYDFSNSGVGIWSNRAMSPDVRLDLRFKKPFWADELKLRGLVRQVFPVDESDLHYLGVEFEQHLDDCTRYLPKHLTRKIPH